MYDETDVLGAGGSGILTGVGRSGRVPTEPALMDASGEYFGQQDIYVGNYRLCLSFVSSPTLHIWIDASLG